MFDAFGDADVLIANMRRLKISFAGIKHIVISHDHWDHTAGLGSLLSLNKDLNVYLCPGFGRRLKNEVIAAGARLIETPLPLKIRENIFTTGQIKAEYKGETIFEQALVCTAEKGLVIVTGCAHPGLIEIINRVKIDFPGPLRGIFGGFHLHDYPEEKIKSLLAVLKKEGIVWAGPTHCTGDEAVRMFRDHFAENFLEVRELNSYSFL